MIPWVDLVPTDSGMNGKVTKILQETGLLRHGGGGHRISTVHHIADLLSLRWICSTVPTATFG